MEHSQLDFTAAGVASDFFHTFSNFVSGKNFLSTIFSYAAVATLILLLIIILPCILRTLWQNTQKLATELHLAVFRNKKRGRCWDPSREFPPMTKVMWRGPDMQRQIRTRGPPWTCSSIYPKTRICLFYYFTTFTNSSDIGRGLSPTTFLCKKINLEP